MCDSDEWEETTRLDDLRQVRRTRADTASLPAEGIKLTLPFAHPDSAPRPSAPPPEPPPPDQTLESWYPSRQVPPPTPPRARRSPPPPRPQLRSEAWRPPEARPVRPPNPIVEAPPPPPRRSTPPSAEPVSSLPDPEPSTVKVLELIWAGEDEAAIERARRWDRDHDKKLPRRGLRAVEPRKGATWITRARIASHADICAATSMGADKPPARVVEATLTFDVDPASELKATRAALRRIAPHHPDLRLTMESTAGLSEDPLTPLTMLRTAVHELTAGAQKAGMSKTELRQQTRDTLMRHRLYSELHILGGDHLVGRLRLSSEAAPWVAYIPIEAMSALPLMAELSVRAVVTVHARQDPEEKGTHGLRVHALARFVETTDSPQSSARSLGAYS